jgi:hypothetical protein
MRTIRRSITAAVLRALPLCVAPLVAGAQTDGNRYGAWTPPDAAQRAGQNQDVQTLTKELDALIQEAEKSRAANPAFLRDLKALSGRYTGRPIAQGGFERLLFDDFSDGDFQRNPAWSVTSGEFWVEQGYGLRSKVVEAAATGNGSAPLSKEQMAMSILGAVLQGANKNSGGAAAPAPAAPAKASAIETQARISNAFDATLEVSSWKADGVFALALNQGLGGAGYRVEYTAGQAPRLELVRVTSKGRSVIDAKATVAWEDQKTHRLEWIRAADGSMSVSFDGKAILNARDTSFRDPFDGLEISSLGADVIVKSVDVSGAR